MRTGQLFRPKPGESDKVRDVGVTIIAAIRGENSIVYGRKSDTGAPVRDVGTRPPKNVPSRVRARRGNLMNPSPASRGVVHLFARFGIAAIGVCFGEKFENEVSRFEAPFRREIVAP